MEHQSEPARTHTPQHRYIPPHQPPLSLYEDDWHSDTFAQQRLSVSDRCSSDQAMHHNVQSEVSTTPETEYNPWAVPSTEVMQQRQNFRNSIVQDTPNYRRVHINTNKQTGMYTNKSGVDGKKTQPVIRSINQVLLDRELYGSQHVVRLRRSRNWSSPANKKSMAAETASPSTVFDSPPVVDDLAEAATASIQESTVHSTPKPSPSHGNNHSEMVTPTRHVTDVSTDVEMLDPTSATSEIDSSDERKQAMSAAGDTTDQQQLKLPRRVIYPRRVVDEVQFFSEHIAATQYHSAFLNHLGGKDQFDDHGQRQSSSRAISTISIAFSPDKLTLASTHGDHSVKITCCNTGRLLRSLDGHPRTPWTLKYHPTKSNFIASGCLGHQVRLWDWQKNQCLQTIRLDSAIISLSFHPTGNVLAVANGTRLHFWVVASHFEDDDNRKTRANNETALLTEQDQNHMLRCVHFPPNGHTLIIGGVNQPSVNDPRRRNMTFYLRLWDFDMNAVCEAAANNANAGGIGSSGPMPRRIGISNHRTFVPRALLYNDGGFDVSPDGKMLCVCAEYWLPDGVDHAMKLLNHEEETFRQEQWQKELQYLKQPDQSSNTDNTYYYTDSNDAQTAVSAALSKLLSDSQSKVNARDKSNQSQVAPKESPITSPLHRVARSSHDSEVTGPQTPTEARVRTPTPNERGQIVSNNYQRHGHAQPLMYARYMNQTIQQLQQNAHDPSQPVPRTPESSRIAPALRLSPPSPPRGRNMNGLVPPRRSTDGVHPGSSRGLSSPPPPPPPPPGLKQPHALSVVGQCQYPAEYLTKGRYVPHVVTLSLDDFPFPDSVDGKGLRGRPYGAVAKGYRPRMGQLLEACPLDQQKAVAVTCVKFSPSADYCLIGYGVREPLVDNDDDGGNYHPVTAVYRIKGGMEHVSTMLSKDDDVNIARFHPDSGHGFVYGTKQGRVRIQSPRPWMYYDT